MLKLTEDAPIFPGYEVEEILGKDDHSNNCVKLVGVSDVHWFPLKFLIEVEDQGDALMRFFKGRS